MGCGCGASRAAAVKISAPAKLETSSTEPLAPASLEKASTPALQDGTPAQQGNALANIASGRGVRFLGGIPMLKKREAATPAEAVRVSAVQSNIPVAKSDSSYNLFNVLKDTITGKVVYAEDAKAASRLELCNACPNLLAGACTQCGCVVKLKVKYEESSCPIGKW